MDESELKSYALQLVFMLSKPEIKFFLSDDEKKYIMDGLKKLKEQEDKINSNL